MMFVDKLTKEAMQTLLDQPGMEYLRPYLLPQTTASLANMEHAYTIRNDHRILMCCGVAMYWPERGEVWAMIDKSAGKHFTAIHRIAYQLLEGCPVRRLEAAVEVSFEQGHRWARLLGFELEAVKMRAYLPGGKDCSLYARVK